MSKWYHHLHLTPHASEFNKHIKCFYRYCIYIFRVWNRVLQPTLPRYVSNVKTAVHFTWKLCLHIRNFEQIGPRCVATKLVLEHIIDSMVIHNISVLLFCNGLVQLYHNFAFFKQGRKLFAQGPAPIEVTMVPNYYHLTSNCINSNIDSCWVNF